MRLRLAILLIAAATPAAEIRYFQFQRPVQLARDAAGQSCLVLDPETFAHAQPGLADLRLYRGTEETPYVIHDARPSETPQPTIAPINLGKRNGKTVFDAAMPEGEYSDLRLNLTGQNFLASLTVAGAQAASGPWTHIGTYTIFDFSSQHLGRSTVLHLPRSNFRSLHFEIAGPIAPAQILNIVAAPVLPGEPKYIDLAPAGQFRQKGRTSVAEFDLPPNVPVDRIVFAPSSQPSNFSRDAEVQIVERSSTRDETASPVVPAAVVSGNLLRIHRVQEGHHIDEEHLVLNTPQTTFDQPTRWTITIQNGDDTPIHFGGVQAQMLERNLCFEFSPGAQYALYYGDKALVAARYDYATWFAFQADGSRAMLGAEQRNAGFEDRPDARPFTEKHPILLWTALVAVVLLLGVVALRTARRVG